MPRLTRILEAEIQESVWMEIIRRMEELYAQLANDQQELERRTQELRAAKELSENIIAGMNDALLALNSEGTVTLVNDAAESLSGLAKSQLIGGGLEKLFPPSEREQWSWTNLLRRIRQQGPIKDVETVWQGRDSSSIPVSISGAPLRDRVGDVVGAVLVARDLREAKYRIAQAVEAMAAANARARELEKANAELKLLQAQLVQAAKMSSLGRLAAGVAHEINNPLGGILLYSDLVLEETDGGDPRRSNIEKIARLADRCRQIVRDLLDFARPAPAREQVFDVNQLLGSTLNMLEGQQAFHNIRVEWDLAEALPPLVGDPAQLQQAFTNIALNAAEAMSGGGTLRITTAPGADGGLVSVSISDTGCGIQKEHKDRLFEPFFTTKDDGTGLGLAITYSIIERHGGDIEVQSEVGKGTTFVIKLPISRTGPANA